MQHVKSGGVVEVAVRFGVDCGGVRGGFVQGRGDQPSGDQVKQENKHERAGEGQQDRMHIPVRVEQRVQHQQPEARGDDRDADGDEHGSGKAGKIPGKLVVDRAAGVPARIDLDG